MLLFKLSPYCPPIPTPPRSFCTYCFIFSLCWWWTIERKRLWMLCEILPSSGDTKPLPAPCFWHRQKNFIILSYGSLKKTKEHFKEEMSRCTGKTTSTLVQPHQLNGLLSSQGQDKRCCCTKLPLREQQKRNKKPCHFVVLYVSSGDKHKKDKNSLSRAGLLPNTNTTNQTQPQAHPLPCRHHVNRTGNNWKTDRFSS